MTIESEIISDRVELILADARMIHKQALERLEAGDIRDAAEKAWCATKRATDALILARTGQEPTTSPGTSAGLDQLTRSDTRVKSLVGRYYSRQSTLHGDCFYNGIIGDMITIERRIKETAQYISDAEALTKE